MSGQWFLHTGGHVVTQTNLGSDDRPVVVIDPEDAEQMKRLAQAIFDQRGYQGDALATALREFANPTPRIEEPLGLGAVVEDAEGRRWVRDGSGRAGTVDWWADQGTDEPGSTREWSDIKPVRVLSEGVTA